MIKIVINKFEMVRDRIRRLEGVWSFFINVIVMYIKEFFMIVLIIIRIRKNSIKVCLIGVYGDLGENCGIFFGGNFVVF